VTDRELVAKKLAFVETCLRELQSRNRPTADILTDEVFRGYVERKLQLAIQAAIDAASHIVSEQRFGEPRTSRELFELLARNSWLPAELAGRLARMVGFRNLLVHGYEPVDPAKVKAIVERDLGDLVAFASVTRARLARP
jgi:uncharacterized protein YutE (UPF0331/DUF86 family)